VNLGGFDVRALAGTLRDVRSKTESTRPLVIDGVLARELARVLAAGGDPAAVQVGTDPRRAAVYVVVLAGEPGDEQVERLRRAARALVPVMAVQTAPLDTDVPYVPATEVLPCPPGQGFPLREIAATIARLLGQDAVSLAARLPALRPAVSERLVHRASLQAGLTALLAARKRQLFPLLLLQQLRLALDLAAAGGRRLDRERAPELAAVVVAGLAARGAVRRLGRRGSFVAAVSGYVVTRALGEAGRRRHD
jgi:hypothetical protein